MQKKSIYRLGVATAIVLSVCLMPTHGFAQFNKLKEKLTGKGNKEAEVLAPDRLYSEDVNSKQVKVTVTTEVTAGGQKVEQLSFDIAKGLGEGKFIGRVREDRESTALYGKKTYSGSFVLRTEERVEFLVAVTDSVFVGAVGNLDRAGEVLYVESPTKVIVLAKSQALHDAWIGEKAQKALAELAEKGKKEGKAATDAKEREDCAKSRLPKPGKMHTTANLAKVNELINNKMMCAFGKKDKQILKTVIASDEWTVKRNKSTGIILSRTFVVVVVEKSSAWAEGTGMMYEVFITQKHNGTDFAGEWYCDGSAQRTLPDDSRPTGVTSPLILLENINK